jgi:hypothetical protein
MALGVAAIALRPTLAQNISAEPPQSHFDESKSESTAEECAEADEVSEVLCAQQPEAVGWPAVPVWATHEAVRLTCRGVELVVLVDRRDQKRRVVSLARAGEPYHRLRLDARRGSCCSIVTI